MCHVIDLANDGQILLKILGIIRTVVDLAILQEAIELEPRQPEQLAGLIVRELPGSVALNHERFQRLSAGIGVSGNVVRKVDGELHEVQNERARQNMQATPGEGAERDRIAVLDSRLISAATAWVLR